MKMVLLCVSFNVCTFRTLAHQFFCFFRFGREINPLLLTQDDLSASGRTQAWYKEEKGLHTHTHYMLSVSSLPAVTMTYTVPISQGLRELGAFPHVYARCDPHLNLSITFCLYLLYIFHCVVSFSISFSLFVPRGVYGHLFPLFETFQSFVSSSIPYEGTTFPLAFG